MAGRKRQAIAAMTAIAVLGAGLAIHALWHSDAPEGTALDRATEIWAHERLMAARAGATPTAFTSDGCSGGMSEVWRGVAGQFPALAARIGPVPPWEPCCIAHDRAYFDAGDTRTAEASYEARRMADDALRSCVAAQGEGTEQQAVADAMYLAVRVGGGPCSGLSWRWGYGLPRCW